jgi:hypothetical protein
MRNHLRAASLTQGRRGTTNELDPPDLDTEAAPDDDRSFWARSSVDGYPDPGSPVMLHGSPVQRFQRALASGNPRRVRSAAAGLPDIGIAEAAAILLVIERTEPENYERAALRWLAKLATAEGGIGLIGFARAAIALEALPREPSARGTLAEICRAAGLPEAVAVFAGERSDTR